MEIMDGVGTDRWEVRMTTEEKQRRKPEEREIWTPEVIWLVKHQIDIKGPRNRDSFRQLFQDLVFKNQLLIIKLISKIHTINKVQVIWFALNYTFVK